MTRLNPRFAEFWRSSWYAATGCVTLASLFVAGCGGEAAPPAGKSTSTPIASAPPSGGPGYGGSSYGQAEPEKPPRPEDLKTWTDQDYLDAKKENDPRIGPAALAYAQANVGKDPAGEFLVALVTKEPEVEGEGDGSSPYGGGSYGRSSYNAYAGGGGDGSMDGFVGVVAALGVNNTKVSRAAIGQILGGKLATPLDDAAAVSAALNALAANTNPENEATLLGVLIAPEKIRPATPPAAAGGTDASFEPSGVTPASLQQEALGLVAPTASAQLRTKLAKLLGAGLAAEGNPLINFLLEPRPDNVEAQAAMYALPALPAEVRARIESNFLAFSSSALRELLNMPLPSVDEADSFAAPATGYGRPTGSPGYGRPTTPYGPSATTGFSAGEYTPSGEPAQESALTPEQAARVATSVWRNDMIKALVGRLPKGRVERSEANPEANQPLLLLASMPVDPARAALSAWLERQRDEAPDALLNAGAFEQAMSDPGLLAIVKPLAYTKRRARRDNDENAAAVSPYGGGGAASGDEADPLRDLVEVLCRRARAAGRGSGASGEFPLAFQGESAPSVQMAGDFPGSAKLKGLKPVPVSVHYAFVEQEHRLKVVEGHYRRQLTTLFDKPRVKELGGDGVWLDVLDRDKKTGKVRSVDVFIRPAGDTSSTSGGATPYAGPTAGDDQRTRSTEPENLTVEILIVETQTPPDEKPAAEVTRKP